MMMFACRLRDEHGPSTGVDTTHCHSGDGMASGAQRTRSRRHCNDWIGKDNIGEQHLSSYKIIKSGSTKHSGHRL